MTEFAELPVVVLGLMDGRPEGAWHRAPPGKWTVVQIVEHLALGLDLSSRRFEDRRAKPPMRRRPRALWQRVGKVLLVGFGWWPPGRKT
ncbi:MAG: DinB family protein, partial [Gemmatimonadales bacterium]